MDGFLPKKQIQVWILEDKEKLDFTDSSLLLFPRRVAVLQNPIFDFCKTIIGYNIDSAIVKRIHTVPSM